MISRFSFTIDTREWGFNSPRDEFVRRVRQLPQINTIEAADVWDERSDDRSDPDPSQFAALRDPQGRPELS
jgi:hypothetical protein